MIQRRYKYTFCFLIMLIYFVGCTKNESITYALYRNSILDQNLRLHVATFDSADGNDYNKENCELASTLFLNQPSVKTKFWCEKGSFKK